MESQGEHYYEAGHHPEVVQNNKATRMLELLGINEHLRTPSARRELFSGFSDETFQKYIGYINSVSRGKPIQYEYENGTLPMTDIPSENDKAKLMREVFESVRQILQDDSLSDDQALEYAGLTLGGGILLTHPYNDGNGRASRASQYLLTYGNERGDQAVETDLYAALAKLPVTKDDPRHAIENIPPPALVKELYGHLESVDPAGMQLLDGPGQAARMVSLYCDVMAGRIKLMNSAPVRTMIRTADGKISSEIDAPGTVDLRDVYVKSYHGLSRIPDIAAIQASDAGNRVQGSVDPTTYSEMIADIV